MDINLATNFQLAS